MKRLFIYPVAFFAGLLFVNAQTDTLVINLINNQTEKIAISQIKSIRFENLVDVHEQSPAKSNLSLTGNYPNPINDQTNIEFEINVPGDVEIVIFSNTGKTIQTLKCSNCQTGKNYLQWNCLDMGGSRVQNGIYYYEVHYNHEIMLKKMLVVR